MNEPKKIAILGDGGWGTTIAIMLQQKGFRVALWGPFTEYTEQLNKKRVNERFLPGIRIPDEIYITSVTEEALSESEAVVVAIPSKFLRGVMKNLKNINFGSGIIISVVKGIENTTFKRPSEIIAEELGNVKLAVLSGPNIAYEIAKGLPASSVIASLNHEDAEIAQDIFMAERFRVYTSADIKGVELGGALKNIIAIAAGISDGLGLGTNAKAALFTRGLVEMKRLGAALGAEENTFNGLSGMGDLVTTCVSAHSRNRKIGEDIARGKKLPVILKDMNMVAEGIETARSVYHLSKSLDVEVPITDEVYKALFEDKDPLLAVNDLMSRSRKPE